MIASALKDYALRAIHRLVDAAAANQARRAEAAKRTQISTGARCKIDVARIFLKPGAHVTVGCDSMIVGPCLFEREGASVEIGSRTFFAGVIDCAGHIRLGDDVLVATGATITDHASHDVDFAGRADDVTEWIAGRKDWSHVEIAPVVIADKAWIGCNAIILKGVTIGEGAVVGAGAVVTGDVAPYTVVAGNPARLIRRLDVPRPAAKPTPA